MSGRTAPSVGLVLGGEPRVELLPPEVEQRERAQRLRRVSVLLVILAVLLVVGGYVYANFRNTSAQSDLSSEQAATSSLTAQKAKYSEVTSATALIADATAARKQSASTEVLWVDELNSIQGELPPNVGIVTMTMKGRAPWEPALPTAGALRKAHVATFSLVFASPDLFDATALVRELSSSKGFADATPDSVTYASGIYEVNVTLDVNTDALSGRFESGEANK